MKLIIPVLLFIFSTALINSFDLKVFKTKDYYRITDCILRDIDNDNKDEIIIAYYNNNEYSKFVDIYKVNDSSLNLIETAKVPYYTVFFDIGDLDNDGKSDILFLTSDGIYYKEINRNIKDFTIINSVRSEIVVPQPEILKDVNMIIDLNGDKINELVIENIRAIEIYETKSFKLLSKINLQTVLEYALIPGQFYPHLIFYTLPIILIKDLDNDKKKEIITKFPTSINVYGQSSISHWELKNSFNISRDNLYFLSDAYLKFAFPLIVDIDNDNIKELVVSSASLNMPKLKFEAIGDVYFLNKGSFKLNKNKKIVVKGIPLNLPFFYNISNTKYKDFIIPIVPFNLISVFGLLSGSGSVKVPFMYYKQNNDNFDGSNPTKLFEIPIRIENITSFIEELPLDQFKENVFPDFYYFIHDIDKKTVDIVYYFYDEKKAKYYTSVIKTLSIPGYRPELPATLKLGKFTNKSRKDAVFFTHSNLYTLIRTD